MNDSHLVTYMNPVEVDNNNNNKNNNNNNNNNPLPWGNYSFNP